MINYLECCRGEKMGSLEMKGIHHEKQREKRENRDKNLNSGRSSHALLNTTKTSHSCIYVICSYQKYSGGG